MKDKSDRPVKRAPGKPAKRGAAYVRAPVGLDRDRIIDEAIGQIEASGLDALSIKGLADALQVRPNAIYWHCQDRETLLDLIAERAFRGVNMSKVKGTHWRARVLSLFAQVRRRLTQSGKLLPLLSNHRRLPIALMPVMNALASILKEAGLSNSQTYAVIQMLGWHLMSFVLFEQMTSHNVSALDEDEPLVEALARHREQGASRDLLEAILNGDQSMDADRLFDVSLNALLDRIERTLGRDGVRL